MGGWGAVRGKNKILGDIFHNSRYSHRTKSMPLCGKCVYGAVVVGFVEKNEWVVEYGRDVGLCARKAV